MAATSLSALLGGGGSGAGIGGSTEPHSHSASIVLSEFRPHLLEMFTHFCGSSAHLTLSGWMAFADAFDICPGYLSADKLEECFDEAAKGRAVTAQPSSSGGALSFTEFQDALCLLAKAVSEKQWKVRASSRWSTNHAMSVDARVAELNRPPGRCEKGPPPHSCVLPAPRLCMRGLGAISAVPPLVALRSLHCLRRPPPSFP